MSNIFYTGNTGRSTGPHLDFQVYNPATGSYEDPSAYTKYLTVGENRDPFDFGISSPRGPRTHPVTGEKGKMHEGIDYLTPSGTQLNVDGKFLSTFDGGTGGIMSQYAIQTDDGIRELLLLHGSDQNKITSDGAVTEYDIDNLPSSGPAPKATGDRSGAKAKAQSYKEMSKAQLDSAYDAMRSDPGKAEAEGMKMHNAYFNKPKRVLG